MESYFVQLIDPVALPIGPLAVRWYGLAYLAGFLVAWRMLATCAAEDTRYPAALDMANFFTYAVFGAVLGGRLGEVLFYRTAFYLSHPLEFLAVWQGGMASHGGMIGVRAGSLLFARRFGVSLPLLLDDVALAATPGLCFGRLANFVNSEMLGKATDVPWAVVFPVHDLVPRHPVQLYQALTEGPILFAALWIGRRLGLMPGVRVALFLFTYGALRFVTEFYRMVDADYLGYQFGFTNGQQLSLVMMAMGLGLGAALHLRRWPGR